MNSYTKINKYSVLVAIALIILVFDSNTVTAQRYSIDRGPQKKIEWNIHLRSIFRKNPGRIAERAKQKELKKASKNEKKTNKKYWKLANHPKEKGTNKKVYKRMKKDLRIAERHNNHKTTETKLKRLSRKKIKLPKLTNTKIHWPWKKKVVDD